MTEWQPIETAPRDGTRFLAWDDGRVALCVIVFESDEFEPQSRWDKFLRRPLKCVRTEDYYLYFVIPIKGGYARVNIRADVDWNPSHWRTLPPPPETK